MGGGTSKSGFKAKAADAIFDNIDRNNDGKLSVYELASAASRWVTSPVRACSVSESARVRTT